MKKQTAYLFWILLLTFGLMILVLSAQILTGNNISRLKRGNKDAAVTFTLNNRLQELVNLSFELDAKLSSPSTRINNINSIKDSLKMLERDAGLLPDFFSAGSIGMNMMELYKVAGRQIRLGNEVVEQFATGGIKKAAAPADSLRRAHLSDTIYVKARTLKIKLEEQLQETMSRNTDTSARLSLYNKLLAIVAIAAVLILATIIIQHTMRQTKLIGRLEIATSEAKHSASVKEQFLANMSHEIRTPLNAITGFSRLLQQSKLSYDQQQYVHVIEEASGNLIHIVNDILDISSIEAGKLRISKRFFNLGQVLQTTEYIFSEAAAAKQLEYRQLIGAAVPMHLKGDPDRLTQLLTNLISNAVKFTSRGYVRTTVETVKTAGETVILRFLVEDTGAGIPKEKLDLIFQRFEQLDSDKSNVTKGTGLGLSIVKNLTELMGGTIGVKSEPGQGSVFSLEIPFEKAPHPAAPEEVNEDRVVAGNENYNGAIVLLADDNKVNQLLLAHILKTTGIDYVIVSNGQEALEAISKTEFSLVLMDIQMPVMDGYAATKAIREKGLAGLPVVAMTAYAMPGEKEKCISAGMTDYISKPIDFVKLKETLRKYCRKKSIQKESSEEALYNTGFLLNLSGGDKELAQSILENIESELPEIYTQLGEIERHGDHDRLGILCHKLISTFSPLGIDTPIMRIIKSINNDHTKIKGVKITQLVSLLLGELGKFEIQIGEILSQFRPAKPEIYS
ncbi:MAG: ATP-binding protein [Chitinophagaceae bacterium]